MIEGRAEMKYAVPVERRAAILEVARGNIVPDPHADDLRAALPGLVGPEGEPPRGYRVSSVYFDTPTLHGYTERLERQRVRNRLRVRAYGWPGQPAPVFLEAKRKRGPRVIKHRADIGDARDWETHASPRPWQALCAGADPESPAARWVDAVDGPGMEPVCRVAYVRETWCDGTARLTMDHAVGAGIPADARDLRGPTPEPLIPDGWMVLELKFDADEPGWMRALVRTLHLCAEPVSKFALGVMVLHRGGRVAERRLLTPPSILRAAWGRSSP